MALTSQKISDFLTRSVVELLNLPRSTLDAKNKAVRLYLNDLLKKNRYWRFSICL